MTRRDWTVARFFHYHSRLDQWLGAEPSRQPVGRMPPSASPVEIETIERGNLASGEIASSLLDPLLEARLVVPQRHVGTLRRTRLLRQLRSAPDRPVISIVAPPGYGKSSLLVQWATEALRAGRLADGRRHRQRSGRVPDRSRGGDRPPRTARSGALQRDRGGHTVAPDRRRSIAGSDVPTHRSRVRIAIDDAHRITSRACLDILAELVEHLPEGSQVAIAGRARMRLPFARWRASGSLLEIGPTELAMDKREAVGLGRELGLRLPADTATRLTRETEGLAGPAGARDARSRDVSDSTRSERRRSPTISSTTTSDPRCSIADPRPRSRS